MRKKQFAVAVFLLLSFGVSTAAFAHGVRIAYQTKTAVEISAAYDTGEPMAGAQVTVYAPGNPAAPWLTGVCDKHGRFTFVPDLSQPGTWDVRVRHAGHGGIIHVPVGEALAAAGGTPYSPLQLVLMAACVIWGLVGTALFFARRKG